MPEDAVRECPPDEDSENDVLRDGPSPGNDADVGGGDNNDDSNRVQVKDLYDGDDDCDVGCPGGG